MEVKEELEEKEAVEMEKSWSVKGNKEAGMWEDE